MSVNLHQDLSTSHCCRRQQIAIKAPSSSEISGFWHSRGGIKVWILFKNTWLAGDSQQTPKWSKVSRPSSIFRTSICSTPGYKPLMSQWDKCLNFNCDHVGVWCVPCATQCHVFIKVTMSGTLLFGNGLVARCGARLRHPCGSVNGCVAHKITSKSWRSCMTISLQGDQRFVWRFVALCRCWDICCDGCGKHGSVFYRCTALHLDINVYVHQLMMHLFITSTEH
jgi:hypothetical protein